MSKKPFICHRNQSNLNIFLANIKFLAGTTSSQGCCKTLNLSIIFNRNVALNQKLQFFDFANLKYLFCYSRLNNKHPYTVNAFKFPEHITKFVKKCEKQNLLSKLINKQKNIEK